MYLRNIRPTKKKKNSKNVKACHVERISLAAESLGQTTSPP